MVLFPVQKSGEFHDSVTNITNIKKVKRGLGGDGVYRFVNSCSLTMASDQCTVKLKGRAIALAGVSVGAKINVRHVMGVLSVREMARGDWSTIVHTSCCR